MTAGSINLSGVCVKRGRRTILNIENLRIPAGDFIGIIGSNGAGKTTLLKVCCGLIKPNRGTVRFGENDLARLSPWAKSSLRKKIGYIPQAAEYNPELPFTLREVVAMGRTSVRSLLTRLSRSDFEIVDKWISKLGLSRLNYQTFRSLSGGEQQKALVARAMVQDPAVLMLDEPCANLDFNWKYKLTEIIEQLYSQTRLTVLLVSHDMSLLPAACKRIVLLQEGKILSDGDASEILGFLKLKT